MTAGDQLCVSAAPRELPAWQERAPGPAYGTTGVAWYDTTFQPDAPRA